MKFLNYLKLLLTREVCNSPLRFFFVRRDPLWSYGMKSGSADETIFQVPNNCLFSHMLGLLPIHAKINIWVGLGDLKHCFPQ